MKVKSIAPATAISRCHFLFGGFEVDMSWNDGRLAYAVIHSKSGLACKVVWGGQTWEFKTTAGQSYPLRPADK